MSDLAALHKAITGHHGGAFAKMEWADDEIRQAMRRHPAQADLVWHMFGLLVPREIGPGMDAEFVYRGHCRELLDRAALGRDLRPATAAECCLMFSEISQAAPLHGAAAGLYHRFWAAAFPDHLAYRSQADDLYYYERLHSSQMDDDENMMRRKLSDRRRVFAPSNCDGEHYGKDVDCRFVKEPENLFDFLAAAA